MPAGEANAELFDALEAAIRANAVKSLETTVPANALTYATAAKELAQAVEALGVKFHS